MKKKVATKREEIRITCEAATTLPLAEFEEFQGDLKWLEEKEYEKLKASILEDGYHDPIHVWKKKGERKPRKMLGHQRVRTLRRMIEKEGYSLNGGRLPVVWVIADDEKQAGRIVLEKMSQYGKYHESTLHQFIHERDLDWAEDVKPFVDWPTINMGKFELRWEGEIPSGDITVEPQSEELANQHKCPKCGFEWTGGAKSGIKNDGFS